MSRPTTDLETGSRSVVGLDIVTGNTGHVDKSQTGVLHLGLDTELHTDLGASGDLENVGVAGIGEGALVADDVLAVDVGVVTNVLSRVGRELDGVEGSGAGELADVLPWLSTGTVDDVGLEEVMGAGHVGEGADSESGGLHDCWCWGLGLEVGSEVIQRKSDPAAKRKKTLERKNDKRQRVNG